MKILKNSIKINLLMLAFMVGLSMNAQVGIGTETPEGALDIKSDSKGLLIPRVALTSNVDNTTVVNANGGALVTSTIVYNTGLNLRPAGFYYWNGSLWQNMSGNEIGDISYKLKSADHNGWYLLNGRAVSTLPVNAQNSAASLGFTGNLPNGTNRVLKAPTGSETLGSQVGSATLAITQNNLPNFNMSATTSNNGAHTPTGTTSTDGSHQHAYEDSGTGNRGVSLNLLSTGSFARSETSSKTTTAAGNHSHTLNINPIAGHDHTVTVNSGGSSQPLSNVPASLVANMFIFLGR